MLKEKKYLEVDSVIKALTSKIQTFFYNQKDDKIPRSCWIDDDGSGAKVYIRKGYYIVNERRDLRCCFCFASIDIPFELQKQGIFKSLLDYVIANSPFDVIYIESVCNLDLVSFLIKKGFKVKLGDELIPEGARSYYLDLEL